MKFQLNSTSCLSESSVGCLSCLREIFQTLDDDNLTVFLVCFLITYSEHFIGLAYFEGHQKVGSYNKVQLVALSTLPMLLSLCICALVTIYVEAAGCTKHPEFHFQGSHLTPCSLKLMFGC